MKPSILFLMLMLMSFGLAACFQIPGCMANKVGRTPSSSTALSMAKGDEVEVKFKNQKKTVKSYSGEPLKDVCKKAGVKIAYSCNKGNCDTCSVWMDGFNSKACVAKILPNKKTVEIVTP
ncbi:unnamed protein product [Heterosigma akashiwo]|mmetsp:Transcript_13488/g.24294  ORF Transcript_13488/g.24294 Transcript_13488/m.24294 type:complete len:120 (-) Transcript_13488:242-601(-)